MLCYAKMETKTRKTKRGPTKNHVERHQCQECGANGVGWVACIRNSQPVDYCSNETFNEDLNSYYPLACLSLK